MTFNPIDWDLLLPNQIASVSGSEDWLIPLLLPKGVNLLSLKRKKGKTWTQIAALAAVSDSIAFGGVLPAIRQLDENGEQRPAIYLGKEGGPSSHKSRISRLAPGQTVRNLYIGTSVSDLYLDDEKAQVYIEGMVSESKCCLLGIDTARRFTRGAENSSDDVNKVMTFLYGLYERYDCSTILNHHTPKDGRARDGEVIEGSGARGSGAWEDAAQAILHGRSVDIEGMVRAIEFTVEAQAVAPPPMWYWAQDADLRQHVFIHENDIFQAEHDWIEMKLPVVDWTLLEVPGERKGGGIDS